VIAIQYSIDQQKEHSQHFDNVRMNIDPNKLEFLNEIHSNNNTKIFHVTYLHCDYVIKQIVRNSDQECNQNLSKREIESKLHSKLSHPYLLCVEGILDKLAYNENSLQFDEKSQLMLLEYCENDSLYKKKGKLTFKQMIRIFCDAANALCYMHNIALVVHRDIKPDNILITKNFRGKLADLEFAREIASVLASSMPAGCEWFKHPHQRRPPSQTDQLSQSQAAGPSSQAEQQLQQPPLVSFENYHDVYAFGATLYFMFVWRSDISEATTWDDCITDLTREDISFEDADDIPMALEDILDELATLIKDCMQQPESTVTAFQVLEKLKSIANQLGN
jgi:serine/threonine protein kinase